MTNEQFSTIMIEFTKLETRLANLEAAVKEIKGAEVNIVGDVQITGAPPGNGAMWTGVIEGINPGVDKLN